ncbi:MAG: hypothetical protein NZ959_09140 [Armatimonadetes bacterium]|nr:hypothetical protein [Armatimonadota bacterium]MDW8122783.1 hypothetical protein [Armatimonadota bacterium]
MPSRAAKGSVLSSSFQISWSDDILTISGKTIPGGKVLVWYLEAFCRPGAHNRDWNETVIPHQTTLLSREREGTVLELRTVLEDGVRVHHRITAVDDGVSFELTASNPTTRPSPVQWAQPCIQVDRFTGADQETYLKKCFIFLNNQLARLPTPQWGTEARYTPGQVWRAPNVSPEDVNPRPLNPLVPSNGLIGCFSADETMILATAWEPYHELFQGVRTCIHSDFHIGGLRPGESKKIKGRIYILPADIPRLLQKYHQDFRLPADEEKGKAERPAE